MAQRRFFGRQQGREVDVQNQPYDGRFTFVRVNYETAPGGYWYRRPALVGARLSDCRSRT